MNNDLIREKKGKVKRNKKRWQNFRNSLKRSTLIQPLTPEHESQSNIPPLESRASKKRNKQQSKNKTLLSVVNGSFYHKNEALSIEQRAIFLLQECTYSEIWALMTKYLKQSHLEQQKKEQFLNNAFNCLDVMMKYGFTDEIANALDTGKNLFYNELINEIQQSLGDELKRKYELSIGIAYEEAKQLQGLSTQLFRSDDEAKPFLGSSTQLNKHSPLMPDRTIQRRQTILGSPTFRKTRYTSNKKMKRAIDNDFFINLQVFLCQNPAISEMKPVVRLVAQDLYNIVMTIVAQADVILFKSENGVTTKSLDAFSELFNQLTNMIAQQILALATEQEMMTWTTFYILVTEQALVKKDYITAFAINNGLNQYAVDRLKLFEKLPSDIKDVKFNHDELLTVCGNFKNLRNLDGIILPPPLIAKDVTSAQEIETGDKNTFNPLRRMVCANALLPMMNMRYAILSDPDVVNKLRVRKTDVELRLKRTELVDTETLFQLSLQRKPELPRMHSAPGPFDMIELEKQSKKIDYQSAPARIEDNQIIQSQPQENERPSSEKRFDFAALRAAISAPELRERSSTCPDAGANSHRDTVKTLVLFYENIKGASVALNGDTPKKEKLKEAKLFRLENK